MIKLIVGLGNPGKKYQHTRHNVGYMAIDEIKKTKPNGIILVKPKTFMNQSGKAVKRLIKKLSPQTKTAPAEFIGNNLLVIHDDIDIPLGKFKIQKGRGAAGHQGVQSIIDELGTQDFWRIRIGICPLKNKPAEVKKFVLRKFTQKEEKIIKSVIKKITQKRLLLQP